MAIHDLSAPARRLIAVSMFAFLPVPASPQADPIPDCSEMLHFDYLEESFLGSPGGPFSPHRYTSTFTNPGPYETWFDVTEIPEWLEVRWDCGTSDGCTLPTTLDPGESVDVWFRLTDVTEGYPVGEYSVELMPSWGWPCSCDGTCPYECTGCAIIAPGILDFTLEVVECAGITAKLLPEITITPTSMILENEERGVYITMLHDLELCGLGILLEPSVPQTIRAAVYDATGSSRGALLADGFFTAQHGGENIYYVPVSLTLEGTEEYEISFTYAGANGPVSVWSESGVGAPFDKSFVRVRDADRYGDPATELLPQFSMVGSFMPPFGCSRISELVPAGGVSSETDDEERGIFITAERSLRICSIQWYAYTFPDQTITARVYEANNSVRKDLLAESTLHSPSSGLTWHDIPIAVSLDEGEDYDLAVEFENVFRWPYETETGAGVPFSVDEAFEVREAELNGSKSATWLPRMRVVWDTPLPGFLFELGLQLPVEVRHLPSGWRGLYFRPAEDLELFGFGWKADIPPGQEITFRLHSVGGAGRDSLLAEKTFRSGRAGMGWHDIPIVARLEAGETYDLEVGWTGATAWEMWPDQQGLPFLVNDLVEVLDGEEGGDPAGTDLVHLRFFASPRSDPTGLPERPGPTAMGILKPPTPNPARGWTEVGFRIPGPAPAELRLFNVHGEVVRAFGRQGLAAGEGAVRIDLQGVPPGVYFLALQEGSLSQARKLIVLP